MIRWIRRIVAGLLAYFSIFPLWVAFGYLRLAVERWFGHPYYLGHSHFERGCFWLLIGLAVLLPAVYCALSRRASAWWLGLGFGAALLAAIALPSNVLPTMLVPRAEETLTARARNLATKSEEGEGRLGGVAIDKIGDGGEHCMLGLFWASPLTREEIGNPI